MPSNTGEKKPELVFTTHMGAQQPAAVGSLPPLPLRLVPFNPALLQFGPQVVALGHVCDEDQHLLLDSASRMAAITATIVTGNPWLEAAPTQAYGFGDDDSDDSDEDVLVKDLVSSQ